MTYNITTQAQRQRLLVALQQAPVNTLEARQEMAIQHPAARVMELRRSGHRIVTRKTRASDVTGAVHLVAEYMLTDDKQVAL